MNCKVKVYHGNSYRPLSCKRTLLAMDTAAFTIQIR